MTSKAVLLKDGLNLLFKGPLFGIWSAFGGLLGNGWLSQDDQEECEQQITTNGNHENQNGAGNQYADRTSCTF